MNIKCNDSPVKAIAYLFHCTFTLSAPMNGWTSTQLAKELGTTCKRLGEIELTESFYALRRMHAGALSKCKILMFYENAWFSGFDSHGNLMVDDKAE